MKVIIKFNRFKKGLTRGLELISIWTRICILFFLSLWASHLFKAGQIFAFDRCFSTYITVKKNPYDLFHKYVIISLINEFWLSNQMFLIAHSIILTVLPWLVRMHTINREGALSKRAYYWTVHFLTYQSDLFFYIFTSWVKLGC